MIKEKIEKSTKWSKTLDNDRKSLQNKHKVRRKKKKNELVI